jgi:hypothetical protein
MNTCIKNMLLIVFLCAGVASAKAQAVTYLQIAHNCADPNLDTIDLYFNGAVLDSNVVYHSATGLISYTPDTAFTIAICHKHSYGNLINSLIDSVRFRSNDGDLRTAYIISGVYGSRFAPNPTGIDTGINILVTALDTVAPDTGFVSLRFLQGVTDLDTVQIRYRNGGQVLPGTFVYGASTATNDSIRYREYEFQVSGPDTSKNYGTFSVNLSTLGGNSILILGSGFLHPLENDSGPRFGLYGLFSTGAVVTFPLEATGFQLLHNSADTSVDSLDIYIDTAKVSSNLAFRNATPELLLNAYAKYNIGIAHKNSTSVNDTFWHRTFFFPRDTFFIATISGLLSQTGYAPNPDGISTAFDVLIKSPAEFEASSQTDFDFYMINGVTDAPPLDLVPNGGPYLLTDVHYADQTNYVSLPSGFYDLYVQDTSGSTLESGFANFLAFNAQSGVLLTSGFLNPAANNNGPAMGLFMVPTTGGPFIPLFTPSGIRNIETGTEFNVFPNPASNQLHMLFKLTQAQNVSLQITDINGQLVKQALSETVLSGTQNIAVDLNGLTEGIYLCRLITNEGTTNSRFAVVR